MNQSDISRIYNKKFFETMIKYEMMSASAFARIIMEAFGPESIIDVGSGNAIYLKAFSDLGVKKLIGYDGSQYAVETSLLPGKVRLHDLRKPLRLLTHYDLCLCMEVAEHLPSECANVLINTLTGLSRRILFTAALPGQGGKEHLNEQPHTYWIKQFQKKDYHLQNETTNRIREKLREAHVIWWIPQNLMIFEHRKK